MTARMGSGAQTDLVDGAMERRVIVFGSLPPDGRDLDLLVRDPDVPRLFAALTDAGFRRKGDAWARFSGCGVDAVDVVPASSWQLPEVETERLFAEAVSLEGRRHLTRLAPADELIVLARRLAGRSNALNPRYRARIASALTARPSAWEEAAARAPLWRADAALAALRRAYETGMSPPLSVRLAAGKEARRAHGHGRARAAAGAARSALIPHRPQGVIVAISGLDGAGKSTQAEALAATLDQLGHDAAVEWSRITYDTSLETVARPVKLAIARVINRRGLVPKVPADDPSAYAPRGPEEAAARALRARFPALNQAWAAVVVGAHALNLRRALRPHLREGRVVVRDRYVLDSAVELRQGYGHRRDVGFATWLIPRIVPPALVGFWLDVPAEVAYKRKPDLFTVERLAARQQLYEAERGSLGAIRIDGTRSQEDICAEIAWETWRRLP